MTNNTWAPKVGMAGMDGAALWLLSLVLEYGLGLQPPGGTGPLYLANQLLALAGLAGITFGFYGLWWGGQ